MHTREYTPDQSFRGSIDTMDEIEDFKTYVAEYFSWKLPRHGEAVFTELDQAEVFLFKLYVGNDSRSSSSRAPVTMAPRDRPSRSNRFGFAPGNADEPSEWMVAPLGSWARRP